LGGRRIIMKKQFMKNEDMRRKKLRWKSSIEIRNMCCGLCE
jgi:hypothetical protein